MRDEDFDASDDDAVAGGGPPTVNVRTPEKRHPDAPAPAPRDDALEACSDDDDDARPPSPHSSARAPSVHSSDASSPTPSVLPASDSDSESAGSDPDPRVAAGVGLSKQDLWKKQQEEEDKRNFFASEEVKAAVRRRAKVREVRAHERFEAMMGEVMRGMEEGIVAETDDVVFKRERALAKKHKEIHDEWEENVYRSIQSQIKSQVDAVDAEALSARLLAQSEKYTKTVRAKQASNAKAGVYLDCVVGYDYDPFEDAGHGNVTYRTSPFKDPTKRDVHKPIVEAIEAGRVKRSAALAELRAGVKPKETLGTEFWNNLAYTPHGRYTDADGKLLPPEADIPGFFKQGQAEWNRHSAANTRDDYEYPIGNEHAQREYFEATRGGTRRAAVPDPGADRDLRGPGGVRDVVNQHTASVANDRDRGEMFQSGLKKGGDKWLEHRGRRYADKTKPLPGCDPDRADLFGVMRYEGMRDGLPRGDKGDTAPRGDEWRALRGKACFEELAVQKSDRKGLYRLLQQSNPEGEPVRAAARNVGDAWMDQKLKDPVHGKFASRWSGDPDGDLYGQLTHTHTYEPTYWPEPEPVDPLFTKMQALNAAGDLKRKSRKHVAQFASGI